MVISNAKETRYTIVMDPETNEVTKTAETREFEVLFLRGDLVIVVSSLMRV